MEERTRERKQGKGVAQFSGLDKKRWEKGPLPAKILALGRNNSSLFVSNLLAEIFKREVYAMFYRVGRIIDVFILFARRTGKHRGFGFV